MLPPNPLVPILVGTPWTGPGNFAPVSASIPDNPALIGRKLYMQGVMFDPTVALGVKFGLTDALEVTIGP